MEGIRSSNVKERFILFMRQCAVINEEGVLHNTRPILIRLKLYFTGEFQRHLRTPSARGMLLLCGLWHLTEKRRTFCHRNEHLCDIKK